jgi:hypothetical protein
LHNQSTFNMKKIPKSWFQKPNYVDSKQIRNKQLLYCITCVLFLLEYVVVDGGGLCMRRKEIRENRGEWSSDTVMKREELQWKKRERWRTEKGLDERAARELQNLRATETKEGKIEHRARSSFSSVPICGGFGKPPLKNRRYLALFL